MNPLQFLGVEPKVGRNRKETTSKYLVFPVSYGKKGTKTYTIGDIGNTKAKGGNNPSIPPTSANYTSKVSSNYDTYTPYNAKKAGL
jgi:hypothetical protein